MADISAQKLLYHLTSLDNVRSILENGLLPRAHLDDFEDVADREIIEGRSEHGLENYVPFHWFARNPFDGRVQADRPDDEFVLVTVRRSVAQRQNWQVIPRHPLANSAPELLDYVAGIEAIDWETMNLRDYHDPECKSICMAECLSPNPVLVNLFFRIYVSSDDVAKVVQEHIDELELDLDVEVNAGMFL